METSCNQGSKEPVLQQTQIHERKWSCYWPKFKNQVKMLLDKPQLWKWLARLTWGRWPQPHQSETSGNQGNTGASISIWNVLFLFPLPKVGLRKFNFALIHQVTLVSLQTSNFKIKYSFDFQARSRERGSLALTSQGCAPCHWAVASVLWVATALDY